MRSNRKYSFDEKINILNLIDSNPTVQSIARKFKIDKSAIYQWKRLYYLNGSEGLRHKRKNRSYSQAFKEKIVQKHIKEKVSFPKLATEYDLISAGMVSNWFRNYTLGKKTYPNRNPRNQKMQDGRKTTQIERMEIAQWTIANDYAYHEDASHFEVLYQLVYTWVNKLNNGGLEALADRRGKGKSTSLTKLDVAKLKIKESEARNKHLEMEKDLSKN